LLREKKQLWSGNFHGLHILDLADKKFSSSITMKPYPQEVDSAGVIRFFREQNGCIWISLLGEHGIIKYDPGTNTFIHYSQQQKDSRYFPFRHFDGIAQDEKGKIWMSYKQSEGLVTYDSARHQFVVLKKNGLPVFNNQVNDLLASKNILWIGSNSGLYKLNLDNYQLKKYTRNEGLLNNNVQALAMDSTGTLWIAMDGGLSLLEPASEWFTGITGDDGLPGNNIHDMYYKAETRRMYCSNASTLFYVAVDSIDKKHFELDPYVTSFSVM
jgi:ligand-binding sensor domain-containing protein